MKLNSKQLREGQNDLNKQDIVRQDIYIILDDVLDTYNIGSVFRLADAGGVKKILLCGGTETPPNPRIKKSSINTTEIVDWEYHETTLGAISSLRKEVPGIQIIAVELAEGSVPYDQYQYKLPVALLVGNESYGVPKEVLKAVDAVVELPMYGINISLNVMVSLAITLYHLLEKVHAPKSN